MNYLFKDKLSTEKYDKTKIIDLFNGLNMTKVRNVLEEIGDKLNFSPDYGIIERLNNLVYFFKATIKN
jgi:hypothetical protein